MKLLTNNNFKFSGELPDIWRRHFLCKEMREFFKLNNKGLFENMVKPAFIEIWENSICPVMVTIQNNIFKKFKLNERFSRLINVWHE